MTAFEALPAGDHEAIATVKTIDEVIKYDCHFHGSDLACHESNKISKKEAFTGDSTFELLGDSYVLAQAKLHKTFKRLEVKTKIKLH